VDGHYSFAHGYVAAPEDSGDVIAVTEIDDLSFPAAMGRGRLLGVQFHPEKSGDRGLALLEDFCRC
jgi:glutamine amidotransferase